MTKLIEAKALEFIKENNKTNWRTEVEKANKIIDVILCGWESEKYKKELPVFVIGGASQMMTISTKRNLIEWYERQCVLEVEDSKN